MKTKGDSRVTALFKVLSPRNGRLERSYFLRVTGDTSFLQAHVRNKKNKEIGEVSPPGAVTCHPTQVLPQLAGKNQGDSTLRSGVTSAVTTQAGAPWA